MSIFGTIEKPKSLLEFHRILAPTAGVRVSPLCLGGMNFGSAWEEVMGKCDKDTTFEILDYFFDQGGNFIDTSNNYQNEESETWIGEWLTARKNRDQLVLATKFTTPFTNPNAPDKPRHRSNYAGNSTKSLFVSLEASLRKLQTSYIDLLYVHWWDFTTTIPELMQSLNTMVQQGKVLYLGISDTPAWVVSKANQYARDHGLRQFSVYQGRWSAADRDFERDIIPMARDEGMALAPWGALGAGHFKRASERSSSEGRNMRPPTENQLLVSQKLEEIASRKNTLLTSVALAYVMHKTPYVFPIVGGRKVEHLRGNVEALGLVLSDEEVEEIDAATDFQVGFPMNFLFEVGGSKFSLRNTSKDVGLVKFAGHLDTLEQQRPIRPHGL